MINLKSPSKILIVLGMHRSGTSCLTGSLQQAGLELGEFSEWNPHNLKGNRENSEIMQLNEKILHANGGSWDFPPRKTKWPPVFKEQARQILAKYSHHSCWGFKDPRTLLTLDGWLDLGITPSYIGIFRHPLAVAGSLQSRNGDAINQQQALMLWHSYNIQLLRRYKVTPFPMLCFDWPEETFHQALNKALRHVGLKPSLDSEPFYSNELLHHKQNKSIQLPWKINRLYRRLQHISDKYR